MADHYSVLGLAPYAEHSAVRAAYLELMRRYHPDINASPEAAARAREVTAAYEVLGNPDSRIDYDLARAQAHAAIAERQSQGLRSPRAIAALATIGGAGLLAFLFVPSAGEERVEQTAALSVEPPSPQPAKGKAAGPSARPKEPARLPEATEAPALPATIEVAAPPTPPKVAAAPALGEVKRPPAAVEAKPRPPMTEPTPSRLQPRRAVAEKPRTSPKPAELAELDRHLGILFRQSVRRADAVKQQSLYRDHYRFAGRLKACATAACKQSEYLARMGEVSKTMAAPAKPR